MNLIEIWKDVSGYEGLYQVSSLGNIRSLYVNRVLSKHLMPNGYIMIRFCKNKQRKYTQLGRVVAKAFLPNLENLPEVNHKDCDPKNNSVDNLEWCTHKYNIHYGGRIQKMLDNPNYKAYFASLKVPVLQFNRTGEFVKRWDSASDVKRETGIGASNIIMCCKGKRRSTGNYVWRYEQQCG